jgi:hypothetical protein
MKRRRVAVKKTPLVIVSFLNIPKDVWFTCILERWLVSGLLRICDVMRFCLCHSTVRNWSIKYELPRRLFMRLHLFDPSYMKDSDMEITWIRLMASYVSHVCKKTTRRWLVRELPYGPCFRSGDMMYAANWQIWSLCQHLESGHYVYLGICE